MCTCYCKAIAFIKKYADDAFEEKEYLGHIERFDVNAKTSSDHTLRTGNEVKINILK